MISGYYIRPKSTTYPYKSVSYITLLLEDPLQKAGALVSFSDVDPKTIEHFRDELGVPFVPPRRVFDTPCDIFSPCALGGILNRQTIGKLKCLAVAGGANNQLLDSADAERLKARNILYAPDYVINIGGAMAILGMEAMGWSRSEAEAKVKSVKETLQQVFQVAEVEGITTESASRKMAEQRLSKLKS